MYSDNDEEFWFFYIPEVTNHSEDYVCVDSSSLTAGRMPGKRSRIVSIREKTRVLRDMQLV